MVVGRGVKEFLSKPAPTGYVAGLGRGAVGFVTRPDLGPGSAVAIPTKATPSGALEEEDRFEDAENEEGLLAARGPLGADDEEADATFAMIEAKMSERRRGRKAVAAVTSSRTNDPTTIFAAEKLQLRQVTGAEWEQLPESGDFIAKRSKKNNERERYTPVPDSVLLGSSLASSGGMSGLGIMGDADFRLVGETRERVLGARLDMAGNETTTTTTMATPGTVTGIDPIGYLTSLEAQKNTTGQVNDLKRARLLLRSAVQTNPQNPSAWISAARIEEVAGNLKAARSILTEALEACPDNEDVWMEAIRLSSSSTEANLIFQKALQRLPQSPKLWLHAADFEKDPIQAKRLLRKGLESNAESTVLWKALIEREEDADDARVLLSKAIECCPQSPELWIALARLETHENARKLLNKARQANPLNVDVWLAAARLEEAHGNVGGIVHKILARAVLELKQRGVTMNRISWLKEAHNCELAGDTECATGIVLATARLGLGEDDTLATIWSDDAENSRQAGAFLVAKTLLEMAIEQDPSDESIWLKMIELPIESNDDKVVRFETALKACPNSVKIWIKYAQSFGENQDMKIFERAMEAQPHSEEIWLASAKHCLKHESFDMAKDILERASKTIGSERIWRKLAKLGVYLGNSLEGIKILEKGLSSSPQSEKLWLLLGQLDPTQWEGALKACPKSVNILIEAARHLLTDQPMRARAILEKGRQNQPEVASLWLASIELEIKLGVIPQSKALLTRALQKCPTNGDLWCTAIFMEPRPLRKAKAMEALQRCCGQNVASIHLAIAQTMQNERNVSSARDYYERAVTMDPSVGDIWGHYLLFIRKYGEEEELLTLEKRISLAHPQNGTLFRPFRKQLRWWRQSFSIIFSAFLIEILEKS